MIHHELKKLRVERGYTLKQVAQKCGFSGTGNVSSYETGRLKAKDETLEHILTDAYGFSKKDSRIKIALWRKQELEQMYNMQLAQGDEAYNKGKRTTPKTLEDFLRAEGFNDRTIKKIMDDVEFYKRGMR